MDLRKKILIGAVLLAVAVGLGVLIQQSGSSSELERYKAELRAKGEKLTYKELALPISTNADEAACRLALEVCSNVNANPFLTAGPIPSMMESIGQGKARVAWRGALHIESAGPILPGTWQSLDRQNAGAAPVLAPVILALRTPAPDSGWIYDDVFEHALAMPRNFVRDRCLAQSLVRAEIGELHHGNFDEARTSLHALIGMARMNRNELTLVSQMIRLAIAGLGLGATWEALQAPGWDEPRLAALQRDWEQVNFMEGMERTFQAERAWTQVLMAKVRHSGGKDFNAVINQARQSPTVAGPPFADLWKRIPWLLYRLSGSANPDELFQLQHFSKQLELERELKANRPWPEVRVGASNLYVEIDHALAQDHFQRLKMTAMAIPNFSRVFESLARTETRRRLTVTAIAVRRYQLKQGVAPPTLAALVPEFFAAAPIDPMSGKTLCYRLNTDGSFVLYSVGEDGKDDGGDSRPASATGGLGFWEGRDAVWPAAASEEEAAKVEADGPKK